MEGEYQRFAEGAVDYLQRYTADSQWESAIGHVFGVSFCRKPDLLSQWRAYGLNGSGVCIGFERHKLAAAFQAGSEIVDVDYHPKRQTERVLALLRPALERYKAEMRKIDPSGSLFAEPVEHLEENEQGRIRLEPVPARSSKENEIIEDCVNDVISNLGAIAHTFKVSAFSEEQEVRLVLQVPTSGSKLENVTVRARGNELVAYIEMNPISGVLPVRRVIVGPSSKSFNQIYAVKILLTRYEHRDVRIERSRFALR